MWLYLIALVMVVLGIAGGIFAGGIFTIVLIPLAAIVLVSGLGYGAVARAAAEKSGRTATNDPLPHRPESNPGHTLATPEQLADERRVRQ